ncbi:MAG: type II secretion system protein [Alphaproteobacteria bacterium]
MSTDFIYKNKNCSQAGFSLVELAIVLIVIGLIVGGVLKGRELIESARLKSVLTQLNEYRVATGTFMVRYNALPGDFKEAKAYISDDLVDGDGDGIISGDGLRADSQARQFWAHLAAARLIPEPGSLGGDGGLATFGAGAPSAQIGGGITVEHMQDHGMYGHWFVLGLENNTKGDGALLTPLQAMSLDKKVDNGDPKSGKIRAMDGQGARVGACIQGGIYNTKSDARACIMRFQF